MQSGVSNISTLQAGEATRVMCKWIERTREMRRSFCDVFNWNSTSLVCWACACALTLFVQSKHPVWKHLVSLLSATSNQWFSNLCIWKWKLDSLSHSLSRLARKAVCEDEMRWWSRLNNFIFFLALKTLHNSRLAFNSQGSSPASISVGILTSRQPHRSAALVFKCDR